MTTKKLAILMAPTNNVTRWAISVTSIDGPSCMTVEQSFLDVFSTANRMWRDLIDLYEPRPDHVELWTVLGTEAVINLLNAMEPEALFAHLASVPDNAINISHRVLDLA